MHKQRIAVLVCAIAGAITTFFPWASLLQHTSDASAVLPIGWHVLSLFGLVLILSIQEKRTACIPRTHSVVASVSFLLAAWLSHERLKYLQPFEEGTSVMPWVAMGVAGLGVILIWVLRQKCHPK